MPHPYRNDNTTPLNDAILQSINDHWLVGYDEDEIFEFLMKHIRLSVEDSIFIRLHIRQLNFNLEVKIS